MYWRLNRIQFPVYNLGPGTRITIWVQGCSLRCAGCISKSLWQVDGGKEISVPLLVQEIVRVENYFDGITITGGEPFDQYEQLIAFCAFLKQKSNLSILCFTGYYLDELMRKHSDKLFLQFIDLLIDGRYDCRHPANDNLRGSTNQTIYQINNGRPEKIDTFHQSKRWSVAIKSENEIFFTGIPKKGEMNKILQTLSQKEKQWRLE